MRPPSRAGPGHGLREDLKPIEQAHAFKALLDRRGWSYRQSAEALHLSLGSVARALALLELPAAVQERVEAGDLAPSVAYEVSRLCSTVEQAEVAEAIVAGGLSRAEAVEVVRRKAAPAKGRGAGKGRKPTSRTYRAAGLKITVDGRRGGDEAAVLAAPEELVGRLRAGAEAA